MMGIIEPAQVIVLTVTGQGVLGQVIGAAGEEVHFLCQPVTEDGGGGSLDHDTDLHMVAEGDALCGQILLHILDEALGLTDFPNTGLEPPVTGLPLLPLSIKASTAS